MPASGVGWALVIFAIPVSIYYNVCLRARRLPPPRVSSTGDGRLVFILFLVLNSRRVSSLSAVEFVYRRCAVAAGLCLLDCTRLQIGFVISIAASSRRRSSPRQIPPTAMQILGRSPRPRRFFSEKMRAEAPENAASSLATKFSIAPT